MNLNQLFGNVTRLPTGGFIEGAQETARTFGGGSLGDEAAVMMIDGLGNAYDGPMARPKEGAGSGSSPFDDVVWIRKLKEQPWWVWVLMVGGTVVVGGAVLKHFAKKR